MAYYKKALYSRIYNKIKFDPVEKFAFVVTLCIATLFSFFSCVNCYAAETEQVDFQIVNNLRIPENSNVFVYAEQSFFNVGYFEADPNYIYHIYNNHSANRIPLVTSSEVPAAGGTYTYLATIDVGGNYTFRGNDYVYFDFRGGNDYPLITREKVAGLDTAVSDLVDNVGINQIWGVFENGTSFIGVVVLVAFGLFLVVLAIKKVSKGKSEF